MIGVSRRLALGGGFAALAGACGAREQDGLASLAARRGVRFGAAAEPQTLENDRAFAALVAAECAGLTPENHLKWNVLRPRPRSFDFAPADRIMAFAQRNRLAVHGHALIWHEANPAWLAHELRPVAAEEILQEHIDGVVGRYAGRIASWDVVNEPVERNDRRPDGLRRSPWLETLGPDYIPMAFEAAHQADPDAVLLLSDYGLEYDDERWMVEKRGTMLTLLAGLKRRGVPIHGLGIQGHLLGDRRPAFGREFRAFLGEVARLGLEIHITELDVNDQNTPGDIRQRDATVAAIYRAFLDCVLDEPAVKAVTTWGLSDRYTSKTEMFPRADGQPVRPLPFDRALARKPAWQAMAQAFSR